jgi:hypothetical protein
MKFYAYVYKDPRPTKNKQPVYVGKGTGDRAFTHWKKPIHSNKAFGNFLALLRRDSMEPVIEIVQTFDSEAEAFVEEIRLITLYGRRDIKTGSLFNLTDGGEGFSGIIHTEEWDHRISEGLKNSEAHKKASASHIKLWADPEYRARVTDAIRIALKDPEVIRRREAGKAAFIHTDEFRMTMQGATLKLWQDPAYRDKVVASQQEAQSTPEARANKSLASLKTWQDTEVRSKRQVGIKAGRSTEASKAKTSAQAKGQWADPSYAASQTANNKEIANRPEVKAAKAAALKAKWADPEFKKMMLDARRKKPVDTLVLEV